MLSAAIGYCSRLDVTYFVHPDTPLDKEAAERSTSTYLVDRRLDMVRDNCTRTPQTQDNIRQTFLHSVTRVSDHPAVLSSIEGRSPGLLGDMGNG